MSVTTIAILNALLAAALVAGLVAVVVQPLRPRRSASIDPLALDERLKRAA